MSFFTPIKEELKTKISHIIEISPGGDRNQSSRARLYAIIATIHVISRNSTGKRKEINPKRGKKTLRLQPLGNNNNQMEKLLKHLQFIVMMYVLLVSKVV